MTESVVRWNDWHAVLLRSASRPPVTISVVIPHYDDIGALTRTLAALEAQAWPRERLEVIIVDDGSPPSVPLDELVTWSELDVDVERQQRRGFGLARARNLGARRARGDLLVFLDSDMLPEPGLLSAHARYHHRFDHVIVIGHRLHTDLGGLSAEDVREELPAAGGLRPLLGDRPVVEPGWRRDLVRAWKGLTDDRAEAFRLASGGNLSIGRRFYLELGGNRPAFDRWGGEDIEFGFRCAQAGAVFVYDEEALAWHQDEQVIPDAQEQQHLAAGRHALTDLIASPWLRRELGPRVYTVPYLLLEIVLDEPFDVRTEQLIDGVLAFPMGARVDVVCGDGSDRERVERAYAADPRVRCLARPEPPSGDDRWAPVRGRLRSADRVDTRTLASGLEVLHESDPRVGICGFGTTAPYGADHSAVWVTAAEERWRRVAAAGDRARSDADLGEVLDGVAEIFGAGSCSTRSVASRRQTWIPPPADDTAQRLRAVFWSLPPWVRRLVLVAAEMVAGLLRGIGALWERARGR